MLKPHEHWKWSELQYNNKYHLFDSSSEYKHQTRKNNHSNKKKNEPITSDEFTRQYSENDRLCIKKKQKRYQLKCVALPNAIEIQRKMKREQKKIK